MSGEVDEDFDIRMCMRGEGVSLEEYFICFPLIMEHYDMENLLAAPQHMFGARNNLGERILVVFEADQEFMPTVFDVDNMLKRFEADVKYDA